MRGVLPANSRNDLYQQLQGSGLELVQSKVIDTNSGLSSKIPTLKSVTLREMIELFIHLEQMQSAGVPMLDALADLRDAAENNALRDMLSGVHRDVSDGASLSEALGKYPKTFKPLYLSLIKAGEDTGDLTSSYEQLVIYLKWVDEMTSKIKKATRYPIIVTIVVFLTMVIMMGFVVPEIVGFIESMDQELGIITTSLIATSEFFQKNWAYILATPVVVFMFLFIARQSSDEFKAKTDAVMLKMPMFGSIIRKISVARYAQTFAALFAAGVDVIGGLKSSRFTVTNLALSRELEIVEQSVKDGRSLSESLSDCGEFPSMVVRMVKIGEESGKLSDVLSQVSEFYTKDVNEAVEGLISMIEPMLTLILGGLILWIAAGIFGPIYSSFENMDF